MDPESLNLILAGFAAYERGDDAVLRELFAPDVEVHADREVLNSGTFHGWDGWKRWTAQWEEAWERMSYEPLDHFDFGEHLTVVPVRQRLTGRGSGVEVVAENAFLFEVRDGKCTRVHLYPDTERALEAARELAGER